jgi:hypothetical protein
MIMPEIFATYRREAGGAVEEIVGLENGPYQTLSWQSFLDWRVAGELQQ